MVFRMVNRVVKKSWTDQIVRSSLRVLSVFFAVFLLFNSGWVYEVAKDNPSSIALNSTIDYPRFNEQEFLGAKWLTDLRGDKRIYADAYRWLLLGSFEWGRAKNFPVDVDRIPVDSYIYLGTWNVMKDEVLVVHIKGVSRIREYINSEDIINDRNKIYANGGAEVYHR